MSKADDILKKYGVERTYNSAPRTGSASDMKSTVSAGADRSGDFAGWGKRVSNLLNDANSFYTAGWRKADEADAFRSSMQDEAYTLLSDATKYRKQYYGNAEATNYINEVVKAISQAKSDAGAITEFWANWDTEEAYNKWNTYNTPEKRQAQYEKNAARLEELKQQKRESMNYQPGASAYLTGGIPYYSSPVGAAHQGVQVASSATEIDEEIARIEEEMRLYEYGETDETGFYYGYKTADDYGNKLQDSKFLEASKNRALQNGDRAALSEYDAEQFRGQQALAQGGYIGEDGNVYDVYGNLAQDTFEAPVQDKLGLFMSASGEEIDEAYTILNAMSVSDYPTTWARILQEGDTKRWRHLKEEEVSIYYGLLNTEGQDAAYRYLDAMEVELGRREMQQLREYIDETSGLEQIMLNVASVPLNMIGGIAATADNVGRLIQGKGLNPYSRAQSLMSTGNYIRSNTAQEIDAATGGKEIPVLGYSFGEAYQAGMSMIDSLVGAKIGGKAYQAMMFMGAASSEMADLYSQGASTEQIVLGGLAAGAAEWIFEKYSIESLINTKSPDTLWEFVKNSLVQGGIEMSEEAATELANIVTNGLIMQSESDWARVLKENGGDYGKALGEMAIQIANAGLSGFLSGSGSGSIQQGMQYGAQRHENAKLGSYISNAGSTDALKQLAMEVAKGASGSTQKKLTSQSERLDKNFLTEGGKNRATGRLYNTVQSAMTEQDISEMSAALQKKGFSQKDATGIAGALAAQSYGMELTDKQQKLLKEYGNSETVRQTVEEILNNEESGIRKRGQSMRDFAFGTINGYAAAQTGQEQAENTAGETVTEDSESGPEGQYEVSADGKTLDSDGNIIAIKGVMSIQNGRMILETVDGKEVDAAEVSFGSEGEALIYETVAEMGASVNAANILVSSFKAAQSDAMSARIYAQGIAEAFRYGKLGIPMRELAKSDFASKLNVGQQEYVYRQGKRMAGKQTAKAQATVRKNRTVAKNATTAEKTTAVGKVHFDRKGRVFNDMQETALTTMEQLSAALGVEFYVYESYVNDAGKRVYKDADGNEVPAPNGWYEQKDGSIHIDLNAGRDGRGTMLFTVAHELTHFIKQWSPAKFKVLANFLVKQYGEKGVSVSELVKRQKDKAKRNGRKLTWEEAYEEMVADSMETMLTDGNVVQVMADLKQQDKGLWEKIKDWFRDLAEKLQRMVDAYKGVQPDTAEGRMVADMQDVIVMLESLYADALADASESFQRAEKNTTEEGGARMQVRENSGDSRKITMHMTDSERTEILKDKVITAEVYEGQADQTIEEEKENLKSHRDNLIKSALLKIGKEFGVFTDYSIADVEIDIRLSKGNLKESVSKKIDPIQIAKLLPTLKTAVENAVGIECHTNRYFYDNDTVMFENLIGGYIEGDYLVPVRFGLKHSITGRATLYLIVDQQKVDTKKIKAEVSKATAMQNARPNTSRSAFNISVASVVPFVNGKDLLRYLPDNMLTPDQKKAKWEGIAETILYTNNKNDRHYADYIRSGNISAAKQMVYQAAKTAGYTNLFYHGAKKGGGFTEFRDWSYFTENKQYAQRYAQRENPDSLYSVYVKMDRPFDTRNADAKRLFEEIRNEYGLSDIQDSGLPDWTDGYDIADYIDENDLTFDSIILDEGGDLVNRKPVSRGLSYVVRNSEQIKSADVITYDDDGNIIPISQRFNMQSKDIRYSDRDPAAGRDYSYEALANKPSMVVAEVSGNVPRNRADVVYQAKQNAAKVGKFNPKDGSVSVRVEDIGRNVILATNGLKHSLDRRFDVNAPVVAQAGEILRNSIRINELTPQKAEASESYVLIGAARNSNGELYVVRSVVNQFSNELASMDVLYAINAKKEPAALLPRLADQSAIRTDSTISIAELLDYVNRYFPDVLPEEVLKYYGYDARPEGKLGEDALYQEREEESFSNRSLLANALESVAQNDMERSKIQEYKTKIEAVNAQEEELRSLNEQIKEMSFAKGKRDEAYKKKLRELRDEALMTANRIGIIDKQLLRLEASKPLQSVLEREKAKAYKRAERRGKEALEAYRKDAEAKQKQIIERYQESRKKATEGRNKTAMRHKIQRLVDELNRTLLHGTKDRHVPEGLQKAVAGILDSLNMEVRNEEQRRENFEATLARYDRQIAMETDPEKVRQLIEKRRAYEEKGDQFKAKMEALKLAYDEIQNSEDPLLSNAYDDGLSAHMMTLIAEVGDTPLGEMSLKQLECVYDVCRIVQTTIRNANKAFKAAKNASIAELGNRVMREVGRKEKGRKYDLAAMEAIRKFGWNNLKPVYAFETIGSDTFTEIFNNVRKGEDVWALDVTEARKFYLEKAKKYGYDSWDFDKRFTFESTSGMEFNLSLEQIMSLYAYSKREQAAEHLRKGGIVFDESTEVTMNTKLGINAKFNPTEATAYNISLETLADIVSKLTKEQKGYVDEMQDYLSTVMGGKGNEVSMEMYGIKLFKEKFYFPLKSASQFMAKAKEQQQGDVKIKNSGFSKETTKKASNPIVLTPFMNVWADHVNEMSMYHAFVLPMEDFYRVYNYRTATSEGAATESVEMHIQNAFGKGAVGYIDQLLKDLNGGARTDSTTGVINKLTGTFKKGAVFASASVVVQQPSAIARAAALVDTKYFIGPKVDHKRHKQLWDEVKQYAPVAIIKEMGYFDTNMGKSTQDFITAKEHDGWLELIGRLDVKGLGKNTKDFVVDSNYRDEVLSRAPALADEIAWCSIWEAVKRETLAKHPGADTASELFLQKAGERFTEVIVRTQVYDSVLSRSANMRSKDTGMKMATAFMAEPTTSINMVADALMKGKQGTVEGRKYCRRTIGAVVASQILNAFLVSFVYAARDDDEEETYLEKYAGSFTAELLDGMNPLTYIPFIKDMVSIVQGYDVERSDMAVISDLWNAWKQLKSSKTSVWRKVEGFAGSICQIFGLPVKNIMRDMRAVWQAFDLRAVWQAFDTVVNGEDTTLRAVWQAFDTVVNGEDTTLRGVGYAVREAVTSKGVSNYEQLYEARLAGDAAHEARVEGRYDDEDSANAAVRLAIKNHFMDGQIDTQTALRQMVLYTGMDASEAHWLMDAWEYRKAMGTDEGYSMYNRFFEAVRTGEDLEFIIKEYTDNDVKQTTLTSMITKHFKPEYIEMSDSERKNIRNRLLDAYEKCGTDREDAEERLAYWEFEAKYGFDYSDRRKAYLDGTVSAAQLKAILVAEGGYTAEDAAYQIKAYDWEAQGYEDVTLAAVRAYEQFCEAASVPKSVFLHIREFSNNTENDVDEEGKTVYYSAMKKVMAEINAQNLTAEQKTALAQSMGWSEKNIKKYKLW